MEPTQRLHSPPVPADGDRGQARRRTRRGDFPTDPDGTPPKPENRWRQDDEPVENVMEDGPHPSPDVRDDFHTFRTETPGQRRDKPPPAKGGARCRAWELWLPLRRQQL